jgi:hypothetical protein
MSKLLFGHQCTTAQKCGWGGKKNGELLRLAETRFELFITCDQNIRYQQNLSGFRIAILELSTTDLRRLQAAAELICSSIAVLQPGQFHHLDIP